VNCKNKKLITFSIFLSRLKIVIVKSPKNIDSFTLKINKKELIFFNFIGSHDREK